MKTPSPTATTISCDHCGEQVNKDEEVILSGETEKVFCCEGCRMVYDILLENNLCTYYDLQDKPGINRKKTVRKDKFDFLDHQETAQRFIQFKSGTISHVTFYIPQMHCSSCVWLLESLQEMNKGILETRTDFARKECKVIYDETVTGLKEVVELLTAIGYEPQLSFQDLDTRPISKVNRKLWRDVGVAGFCFGNIMLLSFPEYLSFLKWGEGGHFRWFSWVNLMLGSLSFWIPSRSFFVSAWKGIQQQHLNIDAPIALAILITYVRSVIDISFSWGPGFLDSMSGIVFFMLIGRFYQDYSQRKLSFDRDFKSFFPAAVTRSNHGTSESVTLDQLKEGDVVKIFHGEVIPADGLLVKGPAMVDYSFVTGESKPQQVQIGELLYAGGRQVGQSIMIRLHRTVSQSYLTSLWEQHHGKFDQKKVSFSHALARNFTYILLVVVGLTAIFWWYMDPHKVFNAITAMLIIACPCALLLAVTFTSGTIQGIMAKNGLYIRSATVLEQMAETDTIIFDKTGTITGKQHKEVTYKGMALDMPVMSALYALSSQSAHPLSKGVAEYLYQKMAMIDTSDDDPASIRYFKELTGKGIEAQVNGWRIKMGSFHFVSVPDDVQHSGGVFYSIDGQYGGHFEIKTAYRPGLNKMIQTLSNRFKLGLISGDKADDKAYISHIFPKGSDLLFEQLPEGKSHYIESLQSNGQRVLMLGDGLNDAIALSRAHTGIAITDDTNLFSPACDAILVGNQFQQLPALIRLAKVSRSIIITTFIVSIMYNIVGLYFAVQGLLTPLQAAIIMPSMTASIVLITTVSGRIFASYYGLKK